MQLESESNLNLIHIKKVRVRQSEHTNFHNKFLKINCFFLDGKCPVLPRFLSNSNATNYNEFEIE